MEKMLKNRQFFYILTLICLAGFLILPDISLANDFDSINLEEMGKYLELPEKDVQSLLFTLKQVFTTDWIYRESSGFSTNEECLVPLVLRKVIRIQALNHLLIDAPIQTTWAIIQNATKIARVFLVQDPSVILNELEKESVKKAVAYGISVLFENEIRVTPGAIEYEYISQRGIEQKIIIQYILIYQPLGNRRGNVIIRFYSPQPIEPPKSEGSIGVTIGTPHSVEGKLPPFIVDIRGTVEDYKWVDNPSIKIDFPPEVPDLGIKPLSWWEKYVLKPIESTIKDVEIIITKITGKSLGLTDIWDGVKSFISKITSFLPAAVVETEVKEISKDGQMELDNILNILPPKTEELSSEKLMEVESSSIEEKESEVTSKPEISLEELQEVLDDIAEQIDILTQKLAELTEAKKQQTEEVIEEIEEVEEEEILDEDLDKKEKEDDVCFKSININTASKEELQKITSVGPVIAQRIIEARPFSSLNDLVRVKGIGEKTLQNIINQDCAYIDEFYSGYGGGGGGGGGGGASGQQTQPKITLSYLETNPVNKEIEATLSLTDLKNTLYDVKISIEKEDVVLSEIYNQKEDKWQSSHYYLKEVFSGKSFEGEFQLKTAEEKNDFRGEADIFAKIRQNGKTTIYAEFSGKINITDPEPELGEEEEEEEEEEQPILEVSPESLEFGPVEFEPQILTITNLSSETLEWTATSTAISQEEVDWLQISPFSGVILSEEFSSSTVSVDISDLTEGIYLAKIIITAKGAEENSLSKEIEVTLNISQAGYPKTVLISEVQIADNEFIELYNFGGQDIDASNWYLSYFPAGRDWNNPHLNKSFSESSTSTISAKSYYLIGFGNYPSGDGNPEPDWKPYKAHLSDEAGATGIFSCNPKIATSTSITLEQAIEQAKSSKIDLFGWEKKAKEELVVFETEPFIFDKEEIEGKSFQRIKDAENNYIDTNNNQDDFEIKDPSPTNSKREIFSLPSYSEPPWPMFLHDAQHTGASPFAGPGDLENPDPQILIEGQEENDYFGTPVIGSDGTLYLTARITTGGETKEGLFAFSFNGNQKWVYETSSPSGMPALSESFNIVYVLSQSEGISAIDIKDGKLKWRKGFDILYGSQNPIVGNDGILYFIAGCTPDEDSSQELCLIAVDQSGYGIGKDETYFYPDFQLPDQGPTAYSGSGPVSNPTIDKEGTIYFGYGDTLFAINPDGTKKWEKSFPRTLHDGSQVFGKTSVGTPSIADDGTIYVIVWDEKYSEEWYLSCFHAVDSNNPDPEEEKWEAKCSAFYKGVPVISSAGNVYILYTYLSFDVWKTQIYGFDSQGNSWPSESYGTTGHLILDKEETIYALFDNNVGAFGKEGEKLKLKWSVSLNDREGPLSLGGDGALFIPGKKKLYMIKPR